MLLQKRMVVEQQETTIAMPLKGTDRPAVIDQEAQVLTELTAIYKLADVTKDGKVDQALVNAKGGSYPAFVETEIY